MDIKSFVSKDKNKIIVIILLGILILVVALPLDRGNKKRGTIGKDSIYDEAYMGRNAIGQKKQNKEKDTIGNNGYYTSKDGEDEIISSDYLCEYYEKRLKSILEKSYGEGTMEVMIHMKKQKNSAYNGFGAYEDSACEEVVDGVLVVAKTGNGNNKLDISDAVCALFDLPACKVAVLIR